MITKTDLSVTDAVELLTGFDEKYIRELYDQDIEDLLESQPRDGLRMLAVAVVKREGTPEDDAYAHVMGLSMKQLDAFFADEQPEAMPEEPDTESGKGVSVVEK